MEKYKDIDVPDFMKNKTKPLITKEEQERQINIAYLKGGLMGIATTFVILGMMIIIAIIESL